MNYRCLGKTGLKVSEIGFGGEWLERHTTEECSELISMAQAAGINILDCWMASPTVRSNIGVGIKGNRSHWIIQGHIGSTWQNGQYERSRDVERCKVAFNDLLERLGTDYIDLGMIHYIDEQKEWDKVLDSEYLKYVYRLKDEGVIKHIGMSTHNPKIAHLAVESGIVEMILFSINPAFDMLPPCESIDDIFNEEYKDENLNGINIERSNLYKLCEKENVGITVMKGFAGGRLFDSQQSPFGVALTPVQCLHYALTRPAVASVMVGYDSPKHIVDALAYETANADEKDYASVLANAPKHSYKGQCTYCGHCAPCPQHIDIAMVNKLYDLATMQPTIPESLLNHYKNLSHHADECLNCHACESRCPFGVNISARMNAIAKLFV